MSKSRRFCCVHIAFVIMATLQSLAQLPVDNLSYSVMFAVEFLMYQFEKKVFFKSTEQKWVIKISTSTLQETQKMLCVK